MVNSSRKLQVVGNRSYAVSLPKRWVVHNRLHEYKLVHMHESDNHLILTANPYNKNHYELEVNIKDSQDIQSIILLAYVKGITCLKLNYADKKQYAEAKKHINKMLVHLEGFNITDEGPQHIHIEYFYNNYDVDLSKLLRRIASILNQMVECIANDDITTQHLLENEVDSLYHLSRRLLYLVSINNEMRQTNNIKDIEEIFSLRLIFKKLETIADVMEQASKDKSQSIKSFQKIINYLNDVFIYQKTVQQKTIAEVEMIKCTGTIEEVRRLTEDILKLVVLIQLNKELF